MRNVDANEESWLRSGHKLCPVPVAWIRLDVHAAALIVHFAPQIRVKCGLADLEESFALQALRNDAMLEFAFCLYVVVKMLISVAEYKQKKSILRKF